MIGIVQANADKLPHLPDAGTKARLAIHQRKFGQIESSQARKRLGRDRLACDVWHNCGEISHRAIRIQNAGLLSPRCSVAQKLHEGSSSDWGDGRLSLSPTFFLSREVSSSEMTIERYFPTSAQNPRRLHPCDSPTKKRTLHSCAHRMIC